MSICQASQKAGARIRRTPMALCMLLPNSRSRWDAANQIAHQSPSDKTRLRSTPLAFPVEDWPLLPRRPFASACPEGCVDRHGQHPGTVWLCIKISYSQLCSLPAPPSKCLTRNEARYLNRLSSPPRKRGSRATVRTLRPLLGWTAPYGIELCQAVRL